jgi:hypothetical protein
MDLKLHRPHGCCHHSRRAFVPGELLYSALARGPTGLERIDCAAECWSGPPEQTLAWWRSTFPAAQGGGPELAPVDVLLDVLEQLDGHPDDAALRYLLALELVRRRVLRLVDRHGAVVTPPESEALHVACRRRDTTYSVAVIPPSQADVAAVQDRLTTLLWSGGAA